MLFSNLKEFCNRNNAFEVGTALSGLFLIGCVFFRPKIDTARNYWLVFSYFLYVTEYPNIGKANSAPYAILSHIYDCICSANGHVFYDHVIIFAISNLSCVCVINLKLLLLNKF